MPEAIDVVWVVNLLRVLRQNDVRLFRYGELQIELASPDLQPAGVHESMEAPFPPRETQDSAPAGSFSASESGEEINERYAHTRLVPVNLRELRKLGKRPA